jgi:uncharacterized protein DUF4276
MSVTHLPPLACRCRSDARMPLAHLEVLVEEPSAETALNILLPQMIGTATFRVYPHTGKDNLLRKLPQRLNTYRRTLLPDWAVLVLIDADSRDCRVLKLELENMASAAGLTTRTTNPGRYNVLNRIVVQELEAWYFGDWQAVRSAYPGVPATIARRAAFRDPDAITGGTWEAFERVLQRAGYFRGGLPKLDAAQNIAPHMDLFRNTSRSFQALRNALVVLSGI